MIEQGKPQLTGVLVAQTAEEAGAKAKRLAAGLGARIGEILRICGNAWAAASMYEDLARLSDAELERRGIPRGEINRCVFEAVTGPPLRL